MKKIWIVLIILIIRKKRRKYKMEDCKNYAIFVLGYDLLNKSLLNGQYPECDLAYKKCEQIAEDFLKSDYNVNTMSLYDALVIYIDEKNHLKFLENEEDELLEQ